MRDAAAATADDLNQRIAARVRTLRAGRGLSLATLAARSGVSRSMISLIERGETSPTAVVLEKLTSALGVTLPALFATAGAAPAASAGPVARRADQVEWRDPASGYLRRSVSPPDAHGLQLVEVEFPAGARVAFENARRAAHVHQQIWVLDGTLHVTVGAARHRLATGDCLAMQLDQPVLFHNPTRRRTRYAVAIVDHAPGRRP